VRTTSITVSHGSAGSTSVTVSYGSVGVAAAGHSPSARMALIASDAASAACDISSAATAGKAMFAPPVAIAPVRPGTDAQKDAAIEITRPIEAVRSAGIGRVVVITVRADRWRAAYADDELCFSGRNESQRG